MDVETLALLKLVILAGLAYLTLRKTRQLHDTHQIAQAAKKSCKIQDITLRSQPIIPSLQDQTEQQTDRTISYEQFTKYHQRIGREDLKMEQESDSDQIQVFSCKGDDQNECFSTAPSDQRRETLSRNSSSIFEPEDRQEANKLQWGQTNHNKTKPIIMPLFLKKLPSTPRSLFKNKISSLKSKTIKKTSFYKKSKDHPRTPKI